MTHTGTGDKCSRWERGVTVDKPKQRGGGDEQGRSGVGGRAIGRTLPVTVLLYILLHGLSFDSVLPVSSG